MMIGDDVARLEQRLANAIYSGSLRLREAEFLQSMSQKITSHGHRAFITELQARWLFTILTNFEKDLKIPPSSKSLRRPASPIPAHSSQEDSEGRLQRDLELSGLQFCTWTEEPPPDPVDFSEAFSSS